MTETNDTYIQHITNLFVKHFVKQIQHKDAHR